MTDFERAVAYVLPTDPVAKLRVHKPSNAGQAQISSATIAPPSNGNTPKIGIGKTGVEFRFYKKPEFNRLSKPQQDELREHRKELMAYGHSGLLPVIDDKGGNKKRKSAGGQSNKSNKKGKKKGAKNPTPAPTNPSTTANVSSLTAVPPVPLAVNVTQPTPPIVDPKPVPTPGSMIEEAEQLKQAKIREILARQQDRERATVMSAVTFCQPDPIRDPEAHARALHRQAIYDASAAPNPRYNSKNRAHLCIPSPPTWK